MQPLKTIFRAAVSLTLAIACMPSGAQADQTSVSFDSGSQFLYTTASKTSLLTAGTLSVTGDGAVLQLGYYSTASVANPFSGAFIPLTGVTSANTAYNYTSVGDLNSNGAGAGQFALILSFVSGSTTSGNNLPAAGTPLAIRFYNNTTLTNSTAYNAVSDALWLWQTPASPGPTVGISLDQLGLQWLGGASTAFYTSQAVVPEPSTMLFSLGFVGLLGLQIWVRRLRVIS